MHDPSLNLVYDMDYKEAKVYLGKIILGMFLSGMVTGTVIAFLILNLYYNGR